MSFFTRIGHGLKQLFSSIFSNDADANWVTSTAGLGNVFAISVNGRFVIPSNSMFVNSSGMLVMDTRLTGDDDNIINVSDDIKFVRGLPKIGNKYVAISHVWSHTTAERFDGLPNDVPISSRSKLNTVFEAARNNDLPLWMDVVSINQADTVEVDRAVSEITDVYLRASSGLILLPAADFHGMKNILKSTAGAGKSGYALSLAQGSRQFQLTQGKLLCDAFEVGLKIYRSRIWTVQEAMLMHDILFICECGKCSYSEGILLQNMILALLVVQEAMESNSEYEKIKDILHFFSTETRCISERMKGTFCIHYDDWSYRNLNVTMRNILISSLRNEIIKYPKFATREIDYIHSVLGLFGGRHAVKYGLSFDKTLQLCARSLMLAGHLPPGPAFQESSSEQCYYTNSPEHWASLHEIAVNVVTLHRGCSVQQMYEILELKCINIFVITELSKILISSKGHYTGDFIYNTFINSMVAKTSSQPEELKAKLKNETRNSETIAGILQKAAFTDRQQSWTLFTVDGKIIGDEVGMFVCSLVTPVDEPFHLVYCNGFVALTVDKQHIISRAHVYCVIMPLTPTTTKKPKHPKIVKYIVSPIAL